jgi:hypothetical protein
MDARELGVATGGEVARVVRALGAHRYVDGRLHLIHAFALDALSEAPPALADAMAWAKGVLGDAGIDLASRDERLWRAGSESEIAHVLEGFWTPGESADRAHDRLIARLADAGLEVGSHEAFDERAEDDIHPVLIDAGWEVLPLTALDPERHRGAIMAFGEPIAFEAARFEDDTAIPPPRYLQELPVLGAAELLRGVDADGRLVEPLVLWTEGRDAYHDYIVRGVLRAAKVGC